MISNTPNLQLITPSPKGYNMTQQVSYDDTFRKYFHDLMDEILEPLVGKAREYGTTELEQFGSTLRYVAGLPHNPTQDLQTACWNYATGKVARWTAAVKRGERPSEDTVRDLMVYCMMYLKVAETGEWYDQQLGRAEMEQERES